MDIQDIVNAGKTAALPLEQLRQLAGQAGAFGSDVVELFAGQAERRAVAAGDVLKHAETEARDILASEQRQYDKHMREGDAVRSLQRDIEARTAARGFVPATQTSKVDLTTSAPPSAVLTSEQRMAPWLESRGRYSYQSEAGASEMRLGALVAAMATGNRSRLTDLERRALSEGTDSAGGFTVPEVVASRFIDRLRAQLVVQRAGAQVVPMTTDTTNIARVAQPGLFLAGAPSVNAATGAWKLENDLISESSLVLERVQLVSHTLPLLLKMSVELFEDSVNISEVVEQEMAASTALELDRVALVGTGTAPEPRGILNQSGIQTAALTTWTNWDGLIDATGLLWTVNAEPNAVIYGTAQAILLAKLKDTTGQPMVQPAAVTGIKHFRTSAAGARVFVGDFTNLLIGMRTSFRIEVSREGAGAFERLQIAVRSYIRADVAVTHPNAFAVLTIVP